VPPVVLGHRFAELLEEQMPRIFGEPVQCPLVLGIEEVDLFGDGDELAGELLDFLV
jgi:hypothetical protein